MSEGERRKAEGRGGEGRRGEGALAQSRAPSALHCAYGEAQRGAPAPRMAAWTMPPPPSPPCSGRHSASGLGWAGSKEALLQQVRCRQRSKRRHTHNFAGGCTVRSSRGTHIPSPIPSTYLPSTGSWLWRHTTPRPLVHTVRQSLGTHGSGHTPRKEARRRPSQAKGREGGRCGGGNAEG